MLHLALAAALPSLAPLPVNPDDWPFWRGPRRDAITTEGDWSSEGAEESLWTREVGLGYSSASIADGRLYTLGHDAEAKEDVVWCLDALTGEVRWTHRFPAEIWNRMHGGGTLTTPTLDGDTVYVLNREGNLFALAAEDGVVRWHEKLTDGAELTVPTWGFAASPLVLGDELYINVGEVQCRAKEDGKPRWSSKSYGHAYSTPTPFELGGRPALAVFNSNGLALIDRKEGAERHFMEWKTRFDINAASPLVMGDKVFISSGLKRGGALLAIGPDGLEVVWENKSMSNKMSGSVLLGEHLYGYDENVFKCLGLDGEVAWSERGLGNGAVLGAPERLILTSADGELLVAKASPEGYEELSRAKLFDTGVLWTRPTLVGGLIYVRNSEGTLVCRDHRAKK